ncbi:late embryogenesis abundant protein Lea14-A-like [Canna indica]|uniref:Late embryogenesis abundant protein Lea14-A-like n=1 Tax=Canna indica TaxID=4628 RepID=A0AAQ3K1G3_9LILI|nr:late embryogenesis abundant protein Lea14-A-like [Canna indica]
MYGNKPRLITEEPTVETLPIPYFTVEQVTLKGLKDHMVEMGSKLSFHNPVNFNIPFASITYELRSGNRLIVEGAVNDPGFLPANADTQVYLSMNVPYTFLLRLLRDIAIHFGKLDYTLTGTVAMDVPVVGRVNVPIFYKGRINLWKIIRPEEANMH